MEDNWPSSVAPVYNFELGGSHGSVGRAVGCERSVGAHSFSKSVKESSSNFPTGINKASNDKNYL